MTDSARLRLRPREAKPCCGEDRYFEIYNNTIQINNNTCTIISIHFEVEITQQLTSQGDKGKWNRCLDTWMTNPLPLKLHNLNENGISNHLLAKLYSLNFTNFSLRLATSTHNFKWVKITHII